MGSPAVRLLIEFADGSTAEQAFAGLPEPLQKELLRQPFAGRPAASGEEGFLLLEWEDGWKEVVRVPAEASTVNRYYVISRPEEVGRLSLSTGGAYPELVEIPRRPHSLTRMSLGETFALQPARREREGRKIEQHYDLVPQGDSLAELRRGLRELVQQGELRPSDLRRPASAAGEEAYQVIAGRLGLRPAYNRQDVLDFAARLLEEDDLPERANLLSATAGGEE
jgi:hypothetical protein